MTNKLSYNTFFFLLLIPAAIFASSIKDPDEQMESLALSRPVFKNTVMLRATILGKDVFSGSAVYLGENDAGDYVAITNAHCLMPWYMFGDFRASLSLVITDGEQLESHEIISVELHPNWFLSEQDKGFDIAKLKLRRPITSLDNIKPKYDILKKLPYWILDPSAVITDGNNMDYFKYIGLYCTVVGYGTNGDIGEHFTTNDGKKRATRFSIDTFCKSKSSDLPHFIVSYPLGFNYDMDVKLKERELLQHEFGVRYGMSGGGCYLESEDGIKLVGINRGDFSVFKTILGSELKSFYTNNIGKYLTALGVPMPFMNPVKGEIQEVLNLSVHQQWIESSVKSRNPGFFNWVKEKAWDYGPSLISGAIFYYFYM